MSPERLHEIETELATYEDADWGEQELLGCIALTEWVPELIAAVKR